MRRIKGFDGLRAIAILAVFIEHRMPKIRGSGLGHVGVQLFFALSGWLVCGILYDLRNDIEAGRKTVFAALCSFWKRRALRIAPVYYTTIAAACALTLAGVSIPQWNWRLIPWDLLFLSNVWFIEHTWDAWAGHFWSLAVEWWFYMLSAPLLLLLPKRMHPWALFVITASGYARYEALAASGSSLEAGIGFLPNFTVMALGGAASILLRSRQAPGMSVAGIAAAIAAFAIPYLHHDQLEVLMPLLCVLAVGGLALDQDGVAVSTLELRPLVYLGTISYGFYIFHKSFNIDWASQHVPHFGVWLDALANFGASVGLAAVSYHFMENPLRRLGSRPKMPAPSSAGSEAQTASA